MLVWRGSCRVKGDIARDAADIVAMAASMGLITTRVANTVFTGEWLITKAGMDWLNPDEEHYGTSSD